MQRGLGRGAEGHRDIHEVGVLCCPLIGLGASHGPTHDSPQMSYSHVLCDKLVLRSDIIVKRDFGEWAGGTLVRRGRRLPISKQCSNYDEELLRVQELVFPNKPEVVG